MPTDKHTRNVAFIPLLIGTLLWGAATCLLLEDAFHANRFDVATMATPILTAATVASACLAHIRFRSWRLIGGLGFAVLALLGSIVMATGTLGRIAEARDGKEATINASNRTYGLKADELKAAKAEAARECRSGIGKRCQAWNARVDELTSELSGITVRSTDPKADAIARLASLLGFNGGYTKEIVGAFDPILIPLFLEFGSVLFFAASFGHRKNEIVVTPQNNLPEVSTLAARNPATFTATEALADFMTLREVPAQKFLARRWGVDPGTVSRWCRDWNEQGLIDRRRIGRAKAASVTLALPAPR